MLPKRPGATPPPVTSMADIVKELAPTHPGVTKGQKPAINTARETYLEVTYKYLKNGTLVDRWGNEYVIVYKDKVKGLIIWSKGPNGIDETLDGDQNYGDDIANTRYQR